MADTVGPVATTSSAGAGVTRSVRLDAGLAAPAAPATPASGRTRLADLVALTKPRIIELLLVTTVPPMFLAVGGWPGLWPIVATLLGGMLTAGSANTLNMVRDRDIDAVMERTRDRPLPAGRVSVPVALAFGLALGAVGLVWLWATVGWLPAALSGGALGFYVLVYSCWLKRRTVQNIVIGGAAGAVPALVGWAAVTGTLAPAAWLLFAVVVLWTPPHFWALAVVCDRDYAAAEVPMLPVVEGRAEAARRSLRYAVATVAVSLAVPFVAAGAGAVYTVVALLVGGEFVRRAVHLRRDPAPPAARRLFRFSIVYLTVLFAVVAVDPLLPW